MTAGAARATATFEEPADPSRRRMTKPAERYGDVVCAIVVAAVSLFWFGALALGLLAIARFVA